MEPDVTKTRRDRLRELIERRFGGRQSRMVEETGINAGELSGLLRQKNFGEKKARAIEGQLGLAPLWLDGRTESERPSLPKLSADQLMLAEMWGHLPQDKRSEMLDRMAQDPARYKVLLDALLRGVSQTAARPASDRRTGSFVEWAGTERRKDKKGSGS